MIISESVPGVGIKSSDAASHSVMTPSQQHCSDVGSQSDDVMSEPATSQVDTIQHVASQPLQPLVVDVDAGSHSDDVVCDARADTSHVQDDGLDVPSFLDDSIYHDCISASFAGKLLLFG